MSMRIQDIIDELIGKEGGYVNHPADRGGPTRWGVTQAVAREYGYQGSMETLPREVAFDIYKKLYVLRPKFDQIGVLSEAIAAELVDTGVNMGPAIAAQMLQRCLNGLNRQGKDYPDGPANGVIVPATINALKAFLAVRGKEGETVLLKALNCLQGERYVDIAEKRPANEAFLYGWLRARVA